MKAASPFLSGSRPANSGYIGITKAKLPKEFHLSYLAFRDCLGSTPQGCGVVLFWSLFRFDGIEAGLQILDLTRFLDANRFPLRLKTL